MPDKKVQYTLWIIQKCVNDVIFFENFVMQNKIAGHNFVLSGSRQLNLETVLILFFRNILMYFLLRQGKIDTNSHSYLRKFCGGMSEKDAK
jgi:hypothetical protein